MSKHSSAIIVAALAIVLLLLQSPSRAGTLTLDLGSPTLNGSVVSFGLSGNFQPTAAESLVEFQIDVSGSSPALSLNDTNYSAFAFSLAPALTGWDVFAPFATPNNSFSIAQSATDPLDPPYQPLNGQNVLGTLSIDLAALGLSPLTPYTVRIDGPQTAGGNEVPGQPATFADALVLFTNPAQQTTTDAVIPLPSAPLLSLPLLMLLACMRRNASRAKRA